MFDNEHFHQLSFEEVPLDRDLILMDEKWMNTYEQEWLKHFDNLDSDLYPGFVSYIAARSVGDNWLELSWYPNTYDRFHEIPVFLPKSEFIACVDIFEYDEKPHVFVRSAWLEALHVRPLTAFALVDAIGIKDMLRASELTDKMLRQLRDQVDFIAAHHLDFAFISFADGLLVKQVWSMGHAESDIKYTYSPESLFPVVEELLNAFKGALGKGAYAIMTQGTNAYTDDAALHQSLSGNHVSLNTLGLPFSQAMAIDEAARSAIRAGRHEAAELYLERTFFRSLRLQDFDKKSLPLHAYRSPITKSFKSNYVATSVRDIMLHLK